MKIAVWFDLYSAGREGEGDEHDCCLDNLCWKNDDKCLIARPVNPTLRVHYGPLHVHV